MLYHFLERFKEIPHALGFYAFEEITFRCILAALTSFIVVFLTAPRIIRWLMKKKIGDKPEFNHTGLNELMKDKANVPTMGGIIILLAILLGTLFWANIGNPFIRKALFIMAWYGGIGAADDWLKLTSVHSQRSRDGLKMWEKFAFQVGGAALIALFLYMDFRDLEDAKMFWLPFYKFGIPIPMSIFTIIAILYISATSNAVNFTDGMDGLASGCIASVVAVLAFLCFVASENMDNLSQTSWASYLLLPHIPGAGELSIFFSAILGAVLGFLWFNCHPAQVFMGDTGSLPLGAAMGYGALVTRHEILLLLIGGVFMWELASVVIQIGYFKYSGGKRVFRCAPIHHHFHIGGWSEPQIVVRFWLIQAACAALALATLKIR